MKFAHLGDCHLGGWRQPELNELNFRSFQIAINSCIKHNVDFVLIAGDLFDSAYPPIDTLKNTFREFRKLKEAKIPVFLIAGSHDYSVSGKTFLDVLDKAGFCKNVSVYEERDGKIMLQPTVFKNVAIYGYPGKKSGLEVQEIEKIKLQDAPGLFKILMLHTTIKDAIKNIPTPAVDETKLPKVDYLALAHLHIEYHRENRIYSGPIFPNNLTELEGLQKGMFYIFDNGKITKEDIKIKNVLPVRMEIKNAIGATEEILERLAKERIKDKIVILRLFGALEKGKTSDIDFQKIEAYLKEKGAYVFLKSTSKLHMIDPEVKVDVLDSTDLEAQIIKKFEENNPSKFNALIHSLIRSLQMEKQDDEKNSIFQKRLIEENSKVLEI